MSIRCYDNKMLRRIIGRRLTADSLIITYQQQRRYEDFGYAGYCYTPAQVRYSPITVGRWELARRGNQWQPSGAMLQLGALRLLTGEYAAWSSNTNLLVGLPISPPGPNNCSASAMATRVSYTPYYLEAV